MRRFGTRQGTPLQSTVRWLGVFSAVVLAASSASAQLQFSQPAVDAGTVYAGKPLVGSFAYYNAGSQPIEFLDAKPSCACLKPQLPKQPVLPGAKGTLEMEVNTLGQPAGPGAWAARIKYRTGDRTAESVVVLKAQLITEVTCEPSALQLLASQTLQAQVTLKDTRAQPFTIQNVRTTSPHLQAVAQPPTGSNQNQWLIRVTVADAYPDGRREEIISIYTDDLVYRELKVPVTIVKSSRQRVSATPAEVQLEAAAGQGAARVLLLRDGDNQPVVIDSVQADNPALTCSWAAGPGNLATVKVRVTSAAGLKTNLQIHVKEPVAQTLTIPVEVRAQPGKTGN